MKKQIDRCIDKVEAIMEEFPATRDCDKKLYMAYLWKYGSVPLSDEFKEAYYNKSVPVPESVSRARRHIQKTRLQGNRRVHRKEAAEEVREYFRN